MLEYHHDHIDNKKNIENVLGKRVFSLPFFLDSAGHWYVGPKYFVRRDDRKDYYLLYTISGKGYMKYMGKNHILTKGSAILIDCREFHHYGALENWEHMWFHINGYGIENLYKSINDGGVMPIAVNDDGLFLKYFERFEYNSNRYDLENELEIAHCIMDLLVHLLEKKNSIEYVTEKSPPEWFNEISQYIYVARYREVSVSELSDKFGVPVGALQEQYRAYCGVDITESIRKLHADYLKTKEIVCHNPDWLMEAIGYIETNFASDISVDFLINNAHVSRSLFVRKFKQYTSMSPKQYIMKVRMMKARKMLEKTNDSVSDIAYKCGFVSSSDFSKRFRESFGITPKEYRRGK